MKGSEIPYGNFWGLISGPGIFFWGGGGVVGSPRDFLGLDFCSHSIIPVTLNPEYFPKPKSSSHPKVCIKY